MLAACNTAAVRPHAKSFDSRGAVEQPATVDYNAEGRLAEGGLEEPSGRALPTRETWRHKMDFLMSGVAFGVGLGNVWRFPYLCYKNGGGELVACCTLCASLPGAFLVPYGLTMICTGIPLFFLEVAMGQLTQQGGIGAWKIVPLFTGNHSGIGVASMVIIFLSCSYYAVILAWSLYYLLHSLTTAQLPWTHCQGWWATAACSETYSSCPTNATASNVSLARSQGAGNWSNAAASACPERSSPTTDFWDASVNTCRRNVLRMSTGIHDLGSVNWQMLLCLLAIWIVVYFCVWKGIKFSGKVVYVTATLPYVLLLVLLVRGVTLPGALDGLTFYLKPDWTKLATPQVWVQASTQVFYCYGVGLGVLPALGSYNKFHNNCYRDSIVLTLINSATSLFSGFVVFSFLGFMAQEQGVDISSVAEAGPGLVFVVYPRAISLLPVPAVWAALLFIMLILLGVDSEVSFSAQGVPYTNDALPLAVVIIIDNTMDNVGIYIVNWTQLFDRELGRRGARAQSPSYASMNRCGPEQFAGMEGFVTGVMDIFPSQLSGKMRREVFTGLCCLVSFLLSITMVTQGGVYVFQLFDNYASSGISMLWLVGWECIAVAWVYGRTGSLGQPTQSSTPHSPVHAQLSIIITVVVENINNKTDERTICLPLISDSPRANRFMQDLTAMLGFRPHAWVRWCWSVVSPAVCLGIFLFHLMHYERLTYNDRYVYPRWAEALGWLMALSSMLCIPAVAFFKLLRARGSLAQRWSHLTSPQSAELPIHFHQSPPSELPLLPLAKA
uniref:Sodium- and chloride-dependent creatine transporter 1-like n=1 Tax=Petromyzon marinus TaxID=7757 RepID=A0AAJ7TWU9_PETMA|nr:sodium- and chloride-dependent creatine transporter 1-like [Petromyzon marinus]